MLPILFIMPIVMLLMFGYVVGSDIKNIQLAVLDGDHSIQSQQVVDAFVNSTYFTVAARPTNEAQLKKALDAFVKADVVEAQEVMDGDDLLDALYLQIFNELLAMMMEDPLAIRRATSFMFAAKHLERFGDHCINLAEMVIYMVRGTDVRHPQSRAVARE
jgi:hypothetical protein